jgi:hypothetical protein
MIMKLRSRGQGSREAVKPVEKKIFRVACFLTGIYEAFLSC